MSGIRFMYFRDENRRQTGCLAMRKGEGIVDYQYSVVHPNDTFSKERAKQIAEGRLNKNPFTVHADTTSAHAISKSIMEDLINGHNKTDVPSRVIKSAKLWLNKHN